MTAIGGSEDDLSWDDGKSPRLSNFRGDGIAPTRSSGKAGELRPPSGHGMRRALDCPSPRRAPVAARTGPRGASFCTIPAGSKPSSHLSPSFGRTQSARRLIASSASGAVAAKNWNYLAKKYPLATDDAIREVLSGDFCRCTRYEQHRQSHSHGGGPNGRRGNDAQGATP